MKKVVGARAKDYRRNKKFAEIVARTGDKRRALLESTPNPPIFPSDLDRVADRKLQNPHVVHQIIKVWDKMGLTLDVASQRHLQILTGRQKKIKASDVLKAVDMVYKGHQVPGFSKAEDQTQGKSILQIFIENRIERGLPLPEKIVEGEKVKTEKGEEGENGISGV